MICGIRRSSNGESRDVGVFLIDMARQVQATARTREHRRRARDLEQELLDHLDFIRRFGGQA